MPELTLPELLGVFGFFLSIYTVFLRNLHFRFQVKRSITDDFWFRGVIFPVVWEDFKEFIFSISEARLEGEDLKTDESISLFLSKGEMIRQRFDVLFPVSSDAVMKISRKIDELEEDVFGDQGGVLKNMGIVP